MSGQSCVLRPRHFGLRSTVTLGVCLWWPSLVLRPSRVLEWREGGGCQGKDPCGALSAEWQAGLEPSEQIVF